MALENIQNLKKKARKKPNRFSDAKQVEKKPDFWNLALKKANLAGNPALDWIFGGIFM